MKRTRWKMPAWMKPYAPLITNTGRGPTVEVIEDMYNSMTSPVINLPVSMLEIGVKTQIALLANLHAAGLLVKR